jgi:hypothetical protein
VSLCVYAIRLVRAAKKVEKNKEEEKEESR